MTGPLPSVWAVLTWPPRALAATAQLLGGAGHLPPTEALCPEGVSLFLQGNREALAPSFQKESSGSATAQHLTSEASAGSHLWERPGDPSCP